MAKDRTRTKPEAGPPAPSGGPVVVGLGEVLWDLFPAGKVLGGAPANFACHAQALGARAHVASAVGDDALGREIRERLSGRGVGTQALATVPDAPTGTVTVALDDAGQPSYTIHRGVAWERLSWTEALAALASRADAVAFGTLAQRAPESRQTIRRFLAATPQTCLRLCDINLRGQDYDAECVAASLDLADALKLNDAELDEVCGLVGLGGAGTSPVERVAALADRYALVCVAVTRGAQGSVLYAKGQTSDRPTEPVRVVDTVGAGDAFAAALALGLVRDLPLERVHAHAAAVAAYVCTQPGATPALPTHLVSFDSREP